MASGCTTVADTVPLFTFLAIQMSVDQRILSQCQRLIAEGEKLAPDRGAAYNEASYQNECRAWLVSAEHLISLICKNPLDVYRVQTREICGLQPSMYSGWHYNVGNLTAVLKRLVTDIEAGLIFSIVIAANAETLDDLLDQAREYHNRKNREGAGILATAVFEDTVRRLARVRKIEEAGIKTDQIISDLDKQGAISSIMAKRCRVAAGVRNHALHAQWDKYSLEDVEDVIRLTHQLLTEHLTK